MAAEFACDQCHVKVTGRPAPNGGYAYPPRWLTLSDGGRFALVCSGACADHQFEAWDAEARGRPPGRPQ